MQIQKSDIYPEFCLPILFQENYTKKKKKNSREFLNKQMQIIDQV